MKPSHILAIDVGTSKLRAILFDPHGKSVQEASREYSPTFFEDGRVEQDPEIWTNSLIDVVRRCTTDKPNVMAVTLTSARSSVIPIDTSGRPLGRAIMWQDRRSQAVCDEFMSAETAIYATTGMKINTIVSAPKIAWMKKHQPDLYRRAAKITGIQDYLIRFLTGQFVTDHTFGSRTILMNLRKRSWDSELLDLFGIEKSKLCDLISPGTVCGSLTTEAARNTGVPAGTPIISAGGDQQCAAVGQGVIEPGHLTVNTGTGAFMIRSLAGPIIDDRRGLICNASAIPDQYIMEASILAAGSLYNWFCNLLGSVKKEGSDLFTRVDSLIKKTPQGSNGVIMIPHIAGRGSPVWDSEATGAFFNLRLNTSTGDLARAMLEGLAEELKINLLRIRELTDNESSIRSSGGMSGFDVYNQMLSDAFGVTVVKQTGNQSTALGAWIMASSSLGLFNSPRAAFDHAMKNVPISTFNPSDSGIQMFENLLTRKKNLEAVLSQQFSSTS